MLGSTKLDPVLSEEYQRLLQLARENTRKAIEKCKEQFAQHHSKAHEVVTGRHRACEKLLSLE